MKRTTLSRRGGWVFVDTLVGLAIIAMAAGLFGMTLIRVTRAERTVGQHRVALRIASEALLLAQTDPAAPLPEQVTVQDDPSLSAPTGWRWVNVSAAYHDGRARLTGLIRSKP